jgi:hypothetical protein
MKTLRFHYTRVTDMGGIMTELLGSNIPGFVFSMLIPLLFLIFMLKDRQSKYILSYFCWGLFSVLFAFLLNEWVAGGAGAAERITYNVAPIIEERSRRCRFCCFSGTANSSRT